jgi:RimJ/RimL family protein N-acetyltransferase
VDVYLETERLILRRFTPDDLGAIVALDADPAVMRYITGGQPPLPDDQPDLCLAYWLELYERGDAWGFWAAIERSSGAFVGWFHLRPNEEDPPDEPELGYRLARSVWGRGYGTEGSIALVRHGVPRARRTPGLCADDAREQGVVAGHGESRAAARPDVPHRLAVSDRGRGARRRRVRHQP